MMRFELREWRALAIGWAMALVSISFGIGWHVPVVAIGSAMIIWAMWSA